jgi:hypothetical protein
MKKLFALFLFTILQLSVYAQPSIQWQKCLGGTSSEGATSIQQTTDGGYILTGCTNSNDGDVSGNHGGQDVWVVKLDVTGTIQWQKCLGGTYFDFASSIQQTTDGGYVLTGCTSSNTGDVSGNHGLQDIWVVKLNSSGSIQWQKCLGGTSDEGATSIQQTTDGGYILTGYTESSDGDVSGLHGISYADIWVVKLDCLGTIQWQKCLGGTNFEYGRYIQQTSDGGYIIAGHTTSNDGDVIGNYGGMDFWVVKTDSLGAIQWQKCFGGTNGEEAYALKQTTDGGYTLTGFTASGNGNVSGNHGGTDVWVVKLDSIGTIQWQKCLGGTSDEGANSIQQTTDGGYVLTGYTTSNNGNVSGNHGGADVWVVKLDSIGTIQWQKCLGGTDVSGEGASSIQQTADGGYILTGYATSNDGDVSGNHGGVGDYWVIKLSSTVGMNELSTIISLNVFPNPTNDELNIQVENTVIGSIYQLTDITGRPIARGIITEEKSRISLQGLSSGTYLLSIGDEIRKTLKVVKQ